MSIIRTSYGSMFQFADGDSGIQQIGGSEQVFPYFILNDMTIIPSGSLTIQSGSNLNIRGTVTFGSLTAPAIGGTVLREKYTDINPVLIPTSSITNNSELLATGSFIRSRGTADHMLRVPTLGSSYNGLTMNYIKASDDTINLVTIRSNQTNGISGQTQWSSSDAHASIQLVYHSISPGSDWIITSKVGNWY
jgi:hypothetical protein